MELPLKLYDTDEQAALGVWVLLEENSAPLQHAPVADPTLTRNEQVKRAIIPPIFGIPTFCLCVSVVISSAKVVPGLHYGQQTGILWIHWQRGEARDGAGVVGGLRG